MHSVVGEEKMRETGAEYVSFFLVRCVCVCFFLPLFWYHLPCICNSLELEEFGTRKKEGVLVAQGLSLTAQNDNNYSQM